MSIFNKIKSGAQEAGKKAQTTVEVNRLKTTISFKQKEILSIQQNIGKLVYISFENDNFGENEKHIFSLCQTIESLQKEIEETEMNIKLLRDEKPCPSCNTVVPFDTKFCSMCGHQFN